MKDHNEKYVIRVEIMFVRVFMKDSLEKECVKHHCNSFSALMPFVTFSFLIALARSYDSE